MEESDSALVTCEVAHNDLPHSANLFCVLSGSARWRESLPVTVCSFFFLKDNLATCISNEETGTCRNLTAQTVLLIAYGEGRSAVFKRVVSRRFLAAVIRAFEPKRGSTSRPTLPLRSFWVQDSLPVLSQSAYNEQSQLFGDLTHSVVHRFVAL